MADIDVDVSVRSADASSEARRLPREFNEYVLWCQYLRSRDLFGALMEECRINRGGYQLIDVLAAGLAYFSASPHYRGLREMLDEASDEGWGEHLAGLAGRQRLPSQPSMSRALDAIDEQTAEACQAWLFEEALPAHRLQGHRSTQYRDREGELWDVWGLDGRVQAYRRRALPGGEQYPEPTRHLEQIGARKGYAGRKRADRQMTRTPLQHLGSGMYEWFGYEPGDGDWRATCRLGLEVIEQRARRRGESSAGDVLVVDGISRGKQQLREAAGRPVHVVTRLGDYEALQRREVRARLAEQDWHRVRDGESGPTRWATELGGYEVGGEQYRLVVTRHDLDESRGNGAGHQLGGYQYEIFATDLAPGAWSCADIVWLYYGRAGREENRFRLEDRQMALDRTFSTNPHGQRVMMALGMWVQNLRVLLGTEAVGGLASFEEPAAQRAPEVMEGVDEGLDLEGGPREADSAADAQKRGDASWGGSGSIEVDASWWRRVARRWHERLADKEGWSYDLESNTLACPDGRPLECADIRWTDTGCLELRYRAPGGACRDCPLRGRCTRSEKRDFQKEKTLTIAPPESDDEPNPEETDNADQVDPAGEAPSETDEAGTLPDTLSTSSLSPFVDLAEAGGGPDSKESGRNPPRASVLVPSKLRRRFRRLASRTRVTVELDRAPPPEPTPDYYALDPGSRQHRRQTWEQRHAWNGLREATRIEVSATVPDALEKLMEPQIEPRAA